MRKILVFLAFILFFNACNDETADIKSDPSFKPYKNGEEIILSSVAGAKIKLIRSEKGFKLENNKIIMFDIFGTYCAPCQKEAPFLMNFQLANADKFMLIGLVHFDNPSNEQVVNNFSKKFNAFYFISNEEENNRLIKQILKDIDYKQALQIPFKVVLKNGNYQYLSDNLGERNGKKSKFYLGSVPPMIFNNDLKAILE